LTTESLQSLIDWGFEIDERLSSYLERDKKRRSEITKIGIEGLKGTLYPFQSEGVAFIESHHGRALIADEMGLGKTIQAIAWMQLHRDLTPAIIIVPASLKLNWQKEIMNWMPDPSIEILSGTKPWKPTGDIIILNYDILPKWLPELQALNPAIIIADECHYIKSNSAIRTKAFKVLAKPVPYLLGLSGTPIMNRPIEIYNICKLIDRTFPEYWYYVKQYCAAYYTGFGWDMNGASNTQELHRRLTGSIMIRRLKKDVLTDLPDKQYSFVPMALTNDYEYSRAEEDYIKFVRSQKGIEAAKKASNAESFTKTEGLKQLAVHGKLKEAIAWVSNFLETEKKLVVITTHHFTVEALLKEFGDRAVAIDGTMTGAKKQEAEVKFKTHDKIQLLIMNAKIAIGLNFQIAFNIAFIELPWTPGDVDQCIARLDRIGQLRGVNVYYLLAKGTIEEKIAKMLDSKRSTIDSVIDGKVTDEQSMLKAIMEMYEAA
jgi:SWI/SNF-related matrix-associated actin-dependent regulator 1 of chromatin subfamily A